MKHLTAASTDRLHTMNTIMALELSKNQRQNTGSGGNEAKRGPLVLGHSNVYTRLKFYSYFNEANPTHINCVFAMNATVSPVRIEKIATSTET